MTVEALVLLAHVLRPRSVGKDVIPATGNPLARSDPTRKTGLSQLHQKCGLRRPDTAGNFVDNYRATEVNNTGSATEQDDEKIDES